MRVGSGWRWGLAAVAAILAVGIAFLFAAGYFSGDPVTLNNQYGPQPVRCRVEHFDFTAHAQREDLMSYILDVQPRTCVLVHGDRPALDWFKAELGEKAPGMKVIIPPPGETFEL